MPTTSIISAKVGNSVLSIYCHFDGYPKHNGKILFEHYNTQEKVEKLIALGDLSVLAPSTDCPEGHSYNNKVKGYCVAYGRDRGEKGVEPSVEEWVEEYDKNYGLVHDYNYYWDGSQWFVDHEPLEKVLKELI